MLKESDPTLKKFLTKYAKLQLTDKDSRMPVMFIEFNFLGVSLFVWGHSNNT